MEDTGRRVVGGGSVRDIEEECYLRIEPLSCEWSKKTARFSPCSSLLSMGLFSPLFPFFFLSILLSSDSFLSSFFLFFLSYYTTRGELFLRGGWSGVRGHLGRLHYSV